MYRIISIKILLVMGLFLGESQFCFASNDISFGQEIYIEDNDGNYWRPCGVGFEELDYAEAQRQRRLPLKKRLEMRPDYLHYDQETETVWQRVYPLPTSCLRR